MKTGAKICTTCVLKISVCLNGNAWRTIYKSNSIPLPPHPILNQDNIIYSDFNLFT